MYIDVLSVEAMPPALHAGVPDDDDCLQHEINSLMDT